MSEEFTYEYLPIRGIEREALRFYDAKTKVDRDGKPISIGFKYPNGSYKVRNLSEKSFYTQGDIGKSGLFGRDKFDARSHKYVTITEGELDALSLYQVLGKVPVVSVQSSSSAVRDCTVDHSWLNSFERIYLAFDADAPGRDAAEAVAKLFDYAKVYLVKFTKYKDANEYLQHGEEAELKNIWWNSRKYTPEAIKSTLADFEAILKAETKPGVSYPFPTVTEMTYGIRTGETVLITAPEGVGKTEVIHAIEHHLLKETSDNVGAIFLEVPQKRHLQNLAGIELRRPAHLPDSGCSEGEVLAAVEKILQKDDRLYLYNHFGSVDPERILDTIRFLVSACGCRYILLDHISMVVSGLAGEDERRTLDYLATKLEMMPRELDFAMVVVSHVNDLGQTRGSRYISKIADVRIDLRRDLENNSPIVEFFIKDKNRFGGVTGPAGKYTFDRYTRQYTLVTEQDNEETSVPPPWEAGGKAESLQSISQ